MNFNVLKMTPLNLLICQNDPPQSPHLLNMTLLDLLGCIKCQKSEFWAPTPNANNWAPSVKKCIAFLDEFLPRHGLGILYTPVDLLTCPKWPPSISSPAHNYLPQSHHLPKMTPLNLLTCPKWSPSISSVITYPKCTPILITLWPNLLPVFHKLFQLDRGV